MAGSTTPLKNSFRGGGVDACFFEIFLISLTRRLGAIRDRTIGRLWLKVTTCVTFHVISSASENHGRCVNSLMAQKQPSDPVSNLFHFLIFIFWRAERQIRVHMWRATSGGYGCHVWETSYGVTPISVATECDGHSKVCGRQVTSDSHNWSGRFNLAFPDRW